MGDIVEVGRKEGGISYKARVRRRGARPLTKTFRRKTDAVKWIGLVEAELLHGRDLPRPKRQAVREAIDRYIEEVLPGKKAGTQAVEKARLLFWREHLGDRRLAEVDKDTLLKARQQILATPIPRAGREPESRGQATANRYLAILRHVFSVAIRDWEWLETNPVAKLRPLPEPRGRERVLSDIELQRILRALDKHPRRDFQLIVKLALITGCRRGNAQSIQWENVDLERKTVTFPDTKANRPHTAPITAELAEELAAYRAEGERPGGFVFPSKPGSMSPFVDVKQLWRRFSRQLGFEDLRFHDLRHACASFLAQQNVPLLSIGRLLGHRSLESTKRYAHLGVEDVSPQAEALGARLRRVK